MRRRGRLRRRRRSLGGRVGIQLVLAGLVMDNNHGSAAPFLFRSWLLLFWGSLAKGELASHALALPTRLLPVQNVLVETVAAEVRDVVDP